MNKKYWHWIVFLCKGYIIAVPGVLLICWFLGYYNAMLHIPSWGMRLESRAIANRFCLIELGYIVCFSVLLLNVFFAISTRNKNEFRSTLIFLTLDVISMILLYPATLVVPTL